MIRLLFTALLCVLASSQVTAQNWVSQTLLGLDEDQRNETFTYLLRDSNAARYFSSAAILPATLLIEGELQSEDDIEAHRLIDRQRIDVVGP